MRLGIRIPLCRPLPEIVDVALLAERAGFNTISIPDSPMLWRDSVAALSLVALRTEHVTVAAGIMNVVTRQPTSIASAARTIAELAPERFRLGIGAGDSAVTLTGQRRATTTGIRQGIQLIHDLLSGQSVELGGTAGTLHDAPGTLPIYLAAEGPRNLVLAAEVADGIITTTTNLPWKRQRIQEAVRAVGRVRPLPHVTQAYMRVTDDLERDAQRLKPAIVRSIQLGSGPLLEAAGFDVQVPDYDVLLPDGTDLGHPRDLELAMEVAAQWISDEVAIWFAQNVYLFGPSAEIADRVLQIARAGVDELVCTHGDSFSLPAELIQRMGEEVIPRLRVLGINATPNRAEAWDKGDNRGQVAGDND